MVHLLHRRQIHHRHRVGAGSDAVRLHVVLDVEHEVEENPFEHAVLKAGHQGHADVLTLGAAAHHEHDVVRAEVLEIGFDVMIGAARRRDVAGQHLDRVRTRRFGTGHHQQRRETVAHRLRPERHGCGDAHKHHEERRGEPAAGLLIDCAAGIKRAALFGGLFDEFFQKRGGRRRVGRLHRFNRTQNRGFEARFMFFDVQRNLAVGDPTAQRTDQQERHQSEHGHKCRDAEADDGAGREPHRVDAQGRSQHHDTHTQHERRGAAQRQFHAPALAHLGNDGGELRARFRVCLRHTSAFQARATGMDTTGFCDNRLARTLSATSNTNPMSNKNHHTD